MMDSWIQVGAAGILVGLTLYNAKMVALSVFCIGVVIWYVRDLRKFYDWDYTESNSGDLRQSLNLKIAKLKGYFRRTRILMYAVMPLSVPAIFYAFGSFDPPAIKVWYWTFSLVQSLVMFEIISVVAAIADYVFSGPGSGAISGLYSLAVFIPSLAAGVRRLHDVGKSGWFTLIIFIPLVGVIWLLVLDCTEGTDGANEYGPDPKAVFAY